MICNNMMLCHGCFQLCFRTIRRRVQEKGLELDGTQLLVYAGDVNLLGENTNIKRKQKACYMLAEKFVSK
jgi:hypothetical protein